MLPDYLLQYGIEYELYILLINMEMYKKNTVAWAHGQKTEILAMNCPKTEILTV